MSDFSLAQIAEFIAAQRGSFSDDAIREQLLKDGCSKEQIDEAFKLLNLDLNESSQGLRGFALGALVLSVGFLGFVALSKLGSKSESRPMPADFSSRIEARPEPPPARAPLDSRSETAPGTSGDRAVELAPRDGGLAEAADRLALAQRVLSTVDEAKTKAALGQLRIALTILRWRRSCAIPGSGAT